MKTLFSRLNYRMLIALVCANAGYLGADTVASGSTSSAQTSSTATSSNGQAVSGATNSQASASAAPTATPSDADLKAVEAQRAARHKQAEDLAAQLVQKLNQSLGGLADAKAKLAQQVLATTQDSRTTTTPAQQPLVGVVPPAQ